MGVPADGRLCTGAVTSSYSAARLNRQRPLVGGAPNRNAAAAQAARLGLVDGAGAAENAG